MNTGFLVHVLSTFFFVPLFETEGLRPHNVRTRHDPNYLRHNRTYKSWISVTHSSRQPRYKSKWWRVISSRIHVLLPEEGVS